MDKALKFFGIGFLFVLFALFFTSDYKEPFLEYINSLGSSGPDNFSYEIQQLQLNQISESFDMSVSGDSVSFTATFTSEGGNYDKAKLEKDGDTYKIYLTDGDNVLLDVLVGYKVKGTIKDISPGRYTLKLVDGVYSSKRTIMSRDFRIL
jgi:hypothetical protein